MTHGQELKAKGFPIETKDALGNTIYFERSDGYWWKSEYDSNNIEIYHEDSTGRILDNRPKPINTDGIPAKCNDSVENYIINDVISFTYKGGRRVKGQVVGFVSRGIILKLHTDYYGKNEEWFVNETKLFNRAEMKKVRVL